MRFEVNINKKYFIISLVIGLILIGIVGVSAWLTSNPPIFGHSPGEIDWSQVIPGNNITANSFCINTTTGPSCKSDWGGVGTGITTITAGANIIVTSEGAGIVRINATGGGGGGGSSQWTGESGGPIYYTGGKVGIGTAAPSAALTISTSNLQQGKIDFFPLLGDISYDGGSDGQFIFTNTNANGVTAFMGGNVGIGTITPSAKLDVNGNIKLSGDLIIGGGINLQPTQGLSIGKLSIVQSQLTGVPAPSATLIEGGSLNQLVDYVYSVTAVVSGTESLAAPTNMVTPARGGTQKTARITWTAVQNAQKYRIYGRNTFGTPGWLADTTNLYYDDTGAVIPGAAPPTQAIRADITGAGNISADKVFIGQADTPVDYTKLTVYGRIYATAGIPVYQNSPYCNGPNAMSFTSTCTTIICATASTYHSAQYYDCNGGCTYWHTYSDTCTSSVKGRLADSA
jgi:hypothetical protein